MKKITAFIFLFFSAWSVLPQVTSASAMMHEKDATILVQQLSAVSSYLTRRYATYETTPLTEEALQQSIRDGVMWLAHSQEQNGHFKYEYVPYEGVYRADDNIVRQSGSLYALGEILRTDTSDPYKTSTVIARAITYLESMTKEDSFNGVHFACVLNHLESRKCELGTTSLTLVGILDFIDAHPKEVPQYAKQIEAYATFILSMQKEEGGFRNVYQTGMKTQDDTESSFSNGEALLALARYYAFKKSEVTQNAIDRAYNYLKEKQYDGNLYLWIMAALKDMDSLWPQESYQAYAYAFTSWKNIQSTRNRTLSGNYCAYTEGLASAIALLKRTTSEANLTPFRNELNRLNRADLTLQITQKDPYRIFQDEEGLSLMKLVDPKIATGGFLTSDSVLTERIDYTNHCVNTYLQTLVDIDGGRL